MQTPAQLVCLYCIFILLGKIVGEYTLPANFQILRKNREQLQSLLPSPPLLVVCFSHPTLVSGAHAGAQRASTILIAYFRLLNLPVDLWFCRFFRLKKAKRGDFGFRKSLIYNEVELKHLKTTWLTLNTTIRRFTVRVP